MKKILLLHGANLNWLGKRDVNHYGKLTLKALENICKSKAKAFHLQLVTYQSNHEGDLIDKLQKTAGKCAGIIINPGAFTHYSYALHDALVDTNLPVVEVHLSNLRVREPWRRHSVIKSACIKSIQGKQQQGYKEAIELLAGYLCHAN